MLASVASARCEIFPTAPRPANKKHKLSDSNHSAIVLWSSMFRELWFQVGHSIIGLFKRPSWVSMASKSELIGEKGFIFDTAVVWNVNFHI